MWKERRQCKGMWPERSHLLQFVLTVWEMTGENCYEQETGPSNEP